MDTSDQYLWWQSGNHTGDQIELVVPNHISLGCTTCVSGPLSPSPSPPPPPPPPSGAYLIELPVILFMALSGVHMNKAAFPLLSLKLCVGVGEGRGRGKMYYKACQLYQCTVWLHGVCECVEGGCMCVGVCTYMLECGYNLLPIFLSHILLRVCVTVLADTFQSVCIPLLWLLTFSVRLYLQCTIGNQGQILWPYLHVQCRVESCVVYL